MQVLIRVFKAALTTCPLIAILRGIETAEVDDVAEVLIAAGFPIIEIPLNSPDPLRSIERLAKRANGRALIGAGTVTRVEDVQRIFDAGARMMIAPNTDPDVIHAAVDLGMLALPGFFTSSEGFAALKAGAHALKLFPGEATSPQVLKAHRSVLPKSAHILVVGGVTTTTIPGWMAAGAAGFGIGSSLYKPGRTVREVEASARDFVSIMQSTHLGPSSAS